MLDKSIPYHEVWMVRSQENPLPSMTLPRGFHFVFYQSGDEQAWAEIETAVLEFAREQEALAYFEQAFAPFPKQLSERMLFIEDEHGEKAATCTAWWKEINGEKIPLLHWLAVKPKFQRKGLAAALVAEVTKLLIETESEKPIYLHTQTWSHQAIQLYEKFGYELSPINLDESKNEDYQKVLRILAQQKMN